MKSKWGLIWPVLACVLLPLAASWFAYPDHVPPGFGVFPPAFVQHAPPFSLPVFSVLLVVCGAVALLFLFPRAFGFRPAQTPAAPPRARLPAWFWVGCALMAFFWWLMWARTTVFGALVHYAFTPLWWGFILVLDGLVYRRSGGRSLLAERPKTLLLSAVVSVVAWTFFEYYNYFALGNWYYPNRNLSALPHATIATLFFVAYSTVWPAVFEWHALLRTFPALAARYGDGPRLALPGSLLLGSGLLSVVLMVFFPFPMFWALWIGPLCVFGGALVRHGVWTPFTALARGNWGPLLLSALAALFTGFFWELWNYGSANLREGPPTNPNYWIYEIPYANVGHLFSEMPLLGYFGYLPFGILVWLAFIWTGAVAGFDTRLTGEEEPHA